MARKHSIAEARNQLPALIHDVERGSPVHLTRRGKPVAVLISTTDYERLTRGRDSWAALQAFRARHDLGELNVDEVFAGVRDRSPGRAVKW